MDGTEVTDTLAKLRHYIHVFRNRRGWRAALENQCRIAEVDAYQIPLDMPVRWNSGYAMVSTSLKLRLPITALCASQQMDPSMRDIQLTSEDWAILEKLKRLFEIFVKPSTLLQATDYPTLNMAVPLYLRMIQKLRPYKAEVGSTSAIGKACDAAIEKLDKYYNLTASN